MVSSVKQIRYNLFLIEKINLLYVQVDHSLPATTYMFKIVIKSTLKSYQAVNKLREMIL